MFNVYQTNQKTLRINIQQLPDYHDKRPAFTVYFKQEALIEQIQRNLHDLLDQIMINIEMIRMSFIRQILI